MVTWPLPSSLILLLFWARLGSDVLIAISYACIAWYLYRVLRCLALEHGALLWLCAGLFLLSAGARLGDAWNSVSPGFYLVELSVLVRVLATCMAWISARMIAALCRTLIRQAGIASASEGLPHS